MKNIIGTTVFIITATFSTLALANNSAPATATQAFPTAVNDPITDEDIDFNAVDTNSDGRITLAEAKAAKLTESTFKKGDINGDSFIDKEEYLIAFMK